MSTEQGSQGNGQDTIPGGGAAGAGAGAGGNEPWYAKADLNFDQETKDYIAAKDFKDVAGIVKSARHFENLTRDRNVMQGPVAGKEAEWDGWDKLGWNADPAKYDVPLPDGFEDIYDKQFHGELSKLMHGAKIPAFQSKAVSAGLAAFMKKEIEAAELQQADASKRMKAKLREEWGGKYEVKEAMAKRAMQSFRLDQADASLLEAVTGSSGLMKMFAQIGEIIGEDRLDVLGRHSGSGDVGPVGARADRKKLEADPDFMASLRDARHPLHEQNKARRAALLEIEGRKAA